MFMQQSPNLQITELDLVRLQRLLAQMDHIDHDHVDNLRDKLGQAHVVEPREVPANIVTMNSSLICDDADSSRALELTLTYPEDADPGKGRVSVLSPIGSALLGAGLGETVAYELPNGEVRRLQVREIVFQPEARGWFEM